MSDRPPETRFERIAAGVSARAEGVPAFGD
jgi:hypothetical protein